MKSPLVEALRQASDSKPPTEQEAPVAEEGAVAEPVEAAKAEQSSDVDDLQLLHATGVLQDHGPGILPIDGPGILPIDGPGILPINDRSGPSAVDTDAELYETMALQVAADEPGSPAIAEQSVDTAPYPAVSHSDGRMGISRPGIYAPLMCVALAATAAAINFAYQSAGGGYDNSELTSLSSQTGASDKEDEMGSAGSDRPMNRFELIVGPQTVSPDNARIESARLQSATDALLPDTENLGR